MIAFLHGKEKIKYANRRLNLVQIMSNKLKEHETIVISMSAKYVNFIGMRLIRIGSHSSRIMTDIVKAK